VQAAAAIGIAATFPIFGELIDWFDWPAAFVISGVFTALLALAWTIYGANRPGEHRAVNPTERELIATGASAGSSTTLPLADQASWWRLLRDRSVLLLTLSYAAVGYVEYMFFFWMHHYFEKVLHVGKKESRGYSAILFLAMAAGMIAGGWIADRLRRSCGTHKARAIVAVSGMCAGAILLLLGVVAEDIGWIVTWMALSLAAVGAVEAPVWTTAVELGGRHGGTAAAICNTGGNAGGLIAPILTPLIGVSVSRAFDVSDKTGWQWAIVVGTVVSISGAVLWFWIKPNDERSTPHE
jgi:sugar phosphate permease